MAKSKSNKVTTIPASLWTNGDVPAPGLNDVLSQVAHFFQKLGYSSTLGALIAEAKQDGVEIDIAEWERGISQEHSAPLLELWEQWYQSNDGFPMLPASSAAQKQIKENSTSSESDSSEEEDDESGDSESESDSDSEDETEGHKAGVVDDEAESTDDDSSEEESDAEEEEEAKPAASNKRKREDTPESSSSSESDAGSSDDSSSDESEAPRAKRVKTQETDSSDKEGNDSSDASDSDSDSDGGDSSAASGASDSRDDSSSASGSDDDDASESDSSDSDSDSSESSASPPPKKKANKEAPKPERGGSTSSSATLDNEPAPASVKAEKKSKKNKPAASEQPTEDLLVPASAAPEVAPEDPHAGIHPDRLARLPSSNTEKFTRIPATKENVKAMKKENVPFSRIPKDTHVDPKFASNAYVPYDYAQKAHEDLIVTKGKGFTKEKNKKKRGSYRGGAIDLTPKGIKFED
ncbi:hypothetical protein EJ03DRAFT_331229 [Teratosphaeria nubilosa]|uniref:Srp40 C-terminal domain-containing protein n=1 Tax=Teratosphaeria nubilosa TaxID=161662 RepID=A0A6G1KYF2_9PEZI|nr:hypothetical protein EJ03DRAFT_331229 [Teratosphaeria nubilosa]